MTVADDLAGIARLQGRQPIEAVHHARDLRQADEIDRFGKGARYARLSIRGGVTLSLTLSLRPPSRAAATARQLSRLRRNALQPHGLRQETYDELSALCAKTDPDADLRIGDVVLGPDLRAGLTAFAEHVATLSRGAALAAGDDLLVEVRHSADSDKAIGPAVVTVYLPDGQQAQWLYADPNPDWAKDLDALENTLKDDLSAANVVPFHACYFPGRYFVALAELLRPDSGRDSPSPSSSGSKVPNADRTNENAGQPSPGQPASARDRNSRSRSNPSALEGEDFSGVRGERQSLPGGGRSASGHPLLESLCHDRAC